MAVDGGDAFSTEEVVHAQAFVGRTRRHKIARRIQFKPKQCAFVTRRGIVTFLLLTIAHVVNPTKQEIQVTSGHNYNCRVIALLDGQH